MNPIEDFQQAIPSIEKKIGYTFRQPELLTMAFVHRSFVNENRELVGGHNERLEFLGDSVLGLLIADYLYHRFPERPEGELSSMRAQLVQASACSGYVVALEVGEEMLLGRGEQISGGRGRESIHADLLEAIIGAIYVDGGFEAARTFLFGSLGEQIAQMLAEPERNWKAELQDYTQRTYRATPTYRVDSEEGPDHSKRFIITATVNEEELGRGEGASKKAAQQAAAEAAIAKLEENQ